MLIGDIIATGETLIHCLRYVTDFYREHGASLRNIIIFTIGGTTGIKILERLTKEIREFWPEFEGFITVYYEGIFSTISGQGRIWNQSAGCRFLLERRYHCTGVPKRDACPCAIRLFEKCIIYDGGARRYEIHEHVEEVLDFWNKMLERADQIDLKELLDEKLGYPAPLSYDAWVEVNHYQRLNDAQKNWLYRQELGYIESLKGMTVREIAEQRIEEITTALRKYML